MKIYNSLKFRLLVFFIIFVIVLTITLVLMGVRQLSQTVINAFSEQGILLVEKGAMLIDGDAFEKLAKSLDEEDPFYEATRIKMLDLKELSGAMYFYTSAPSHGDYWNYIVDGSAPPDDEENFSPLGDSFDASEYDDAFRRAVANLTTEISGLVDQGEWGWLISVYTPLLNSKGELVGIVACDFDGEELHTSILSIEIQQTIIGLVGMFIGIVMLLLIMRMIFMPVKEVCAILKEISQGEGDLTIRINNIKENEIGELAGFFNVTLDKIRDLIINIMKETSALSDTGNDLATNMSETAAAINQITENIQSIQVRIQSQSESVSETHATMEQVVQNINNLNNHVENQSSHIASASSAIEEMVANTRSVTDTLVRNSENVEVLRDSSENGLSGLQEVAADIKEIARESEGLMNINSVMENISSQTNLLSMNAAIEAAHAGEAGKGFAVVAGEIRKLAENSSQQSKTISDVLKKIKQSIDKITRSTGNVMNKFDDINIGVKTVADQEEQIRCSMEEQQSGSKQILEGISNINEITRHVEDGSQAMLNGAKEVIMESTSLEKVTQEITSGMSEMSAGAHQINVAVNHIKEISRQNRENITILVKEVSRFKV